ncbi:ankyrin repeat domain-containing protein [Hymenobacter metallicola]|uniref:Ankyrin repeat domain-containing protein n=1 Tax=Hymenobacter metallicola TaxID=2563114 RepID=A0A4Z0QLF5_9BACT|nr:ankyrin repeat domain-containing protein [Hymenobacter metallicola]TGE29881.1 ankyrin repeat domain-containing protein [Hymenobacter metallicola]
MATLELLSAASDDDRATVAALVAAGLDQDSLNQALTCAVAYSHLELAEYLLEHAAQLSWGDDDPLRYAVENGEVAATKFCLARGIAVNVHNGMVLNRAAISMPPEFLTWLIEQGADVNRAQGQALVNAIIYQRLDNVRVLLEHGANPMLNDQQALREAKSRMAVGNQRTVDIQRVVSKAAKNF